MRKRLDTSSPAGRGFSLVELLVVVGIIALLVGILVPTVANVRVAGQRAATQAAVANLANAVRAYQLDFGAYPGPLPDRALGIGQVTTDDIAEFNVPGGGTASLSGNQGVTGAENLYLGLSGGLFYDPDDEQVEYDFELAGLGPRNLNPRKPDVFEPLADDAVLATGQGTGGYYVDTGASTADDPGAGRGFDSPIPEYLDNFSDGLPILYYRASLGADGVVSGPFASYDSGSTYVAPQGARAAQYRLDDNIPYTAAGIGVGREVPEHGLAAMFEPASGVPEPYVHPALYFLSNELSNDPDGDADVADNAAKYYDGPNDRPVARNADTFILVSAGADRVYGTADDVTNFGEVR